MICVDPFRFHAHAFRPVLIANGSSIEGNRRDYSMSGNQTSGKEGGVQCVMAVVCMYVCMLDIVYI